MDHKITAQKERGAKHRVSYHKPTQLYPLPLRTFVLVLFWWLLNRGDHASWIIGAPFIAAAVALSMVLAPPRPLRWRPLQVIRFMPVFLWESLKGGVDVTRRVFQPTMPLHPTIFNYKVSLPAGLPRLLMLNVVSLLPGTLSADMHEDQLTLHVLDKHTAFETELQRIENYIANMIAPVPETEETET